jgi:hypothetical protein
MIDGNGLAGMLAEWLGRDGTTLQRRCQGCGSVHALGEHRAYQGAAWVLRCPGCDALALRITERGDTLLVDMAGVLSVPR